MIKVLVNGIMGKMGTEVANMIKKEPKMHLLGGLDKHPAHNLSYPVFDHVEDIFEMPNVIIDFSIPEATIALLPYITKNKIPIVIATTGFTQDEQEQIYKVSTQVPIFQSANLSFEINLLKQIVVELSKKLPEDVEIEIVETHHNQKKDAPSGTALSLADSINKASGGIYHYNLNRFHQSKKREAKEIGFSSIRGGNIVGEHSVLFFRENETIEIKHTAYSRRIYAEGALKAAMFLITKDVGYYTEY